MLLGNVSFYNHNQATHDLSSLMQTVFFCIHCIAVAANFSNAEFHPPLLSDEHLNLFWKLINNTNYDWFCWVYCKIFSWQFKIPKKTIKFHNWRAESAVETLKHKWVDSCKEEANQENRHLFIEWLFFSVQTRHELALMDNTVGLIWKSSFSFFPQCADLWCHPPLSISSLSTLPSLEWQKK